MQDDGSVGQPACNLDDDARTQRVGVRVERRAGDVFGQEQLKVARHVYGDETHQKQAGQPHPRLEQDGSLHRSSDYASAEA